jgi:hypothetical protein
MVKYHVMTNNLDNWYHHLILKSSWEQKAKSSLTRINQTQQETRPLASLEALLIQIEHMLKGILLS